MAPHHSLQPINIIAVIVTTHLGALTQLINIKIKEHGRIKMDKDSIVKPRKWYKL